MTEITVLTEKQKYDLDNAMSANQNIGLGTLLDNLLVMVEALSGSPVAFPNRDEVQ